MSHSPEPWNASCPCPGLSRLEISDANGQCVMYDGPMSDDDVKRVCACVNACAGIPTEVLENGGIANYLEE